MYLPLMGLTLYIRPYYFHNTTENRKKMLKAAKWLIIWTGLLYAKPYSDIKLYAVRIF